MNMVDYTTIMRFLELQKIAIEAVITRRPDLELPSRHALETIEQLKNEATSELIDSGFYPRPGEVIKWQQHKIS